GVAGGNVITQVQLHWVQSATVSNLALSGDVLDREGWDEHATAVAMLFERLAERSRVVIISGDVHHSYTIATDYYAPARGGQPARKRRIPELVGSSLKN